MTIHCLHPAICASQWPTTNLPHTSKCDAWHAMMTNLHAAMNEGTVIWDEHDMLVPA